MTKNAKKGREGTQARAYDTERTSVRSQPTRQGEARRSETYRARVSRNQPKQGSGLFYLLLPAVIVVVVGVGIFWYMRVQNPAGQTGSPGPDPASLREQASLADVIWPTYVSRGPQSVREAYQFAVVRPDVLQYMPCYCGCGQHNGHRSNQDCFVGNLNQGGKTIAFEQHGST